MKFNFAVKCFFKISVVYFFIFILLLLSSSCYCRNFPPCIEHFRYNVDSLEKKVTLCFDLIDIENDSVFISLQVYSKFGEEILSDRIETSGDVNQIVTPGKKKIILQFDTSSFDECKIRLIARDFVKVDLQDVINKVDSTRIKEVVKSLVGPRNRHADLYHLKNVKNYIGELFKKNELLVYRQPFDFFGYTAENICGFLPGEKKKGPLFVLTAHFDTILESPGADDNASGVAALIEVMSILSDYSFKLPIEFVAFDLEEAGSLGSQVYTENKFNSKTVIGGALNMDMIGYYSEADNSQYVPEDLAKLRPKIFNQLASKFNRGNFILITGNSRSDKILLSELVAWWIDSSSAGSFGR